MAHAVALRLARVAVGALAAASLAPAHADSSIHSGFLRTITGSGDAVVCIIGNVTSKTIDTIRVRIRNAEFLATNEDLTCTDVPVGGACRADFSPGGVPLIVHFACSADVSAKADAVRGTFYRRSSVGTESDIAVEMR